mgnify:CR=1 FL=1
MIECTETEHVYPVDASLGNSAQCACGKMVGILFEPYPTSTWRWRVLNLVMETLDSVSVETAEITDVLPSSGLHTSSP